MNSFIQPACKLVTIPFFIEDSITLKFKYGDNLELLFDNLHTDLKQVSVSLILVVLSWMAGLGCLAGSLVVWLVSCTTALGSTPMATLVTSGVVIGKMTSSLKGCSAFSWPSSILLLQSPAWQTPPRTALVLWS